MESEKLSLKISLRFPFVLLLIINVTIIQNLRQIYSSETHEIDLLWDFRCLFVKNPF